MSENKQLTARTFFEQDNVKKKFSELLGKKAQGFITSVLQVVNSNDLLKNADPASVYNAAATAAILDLPINPNLGFAYIVPYNQKYKEGNTWKSKQVAQFQMGYKGFIQLAQRSGMFKSISAAPIYEGQLIGENPLLGYEFDFTQKKSDIVVGYASYFKLLNGFEKVWFMRVDQLKSHGKRFSQTYKNDKGLWMDDFDGMSLKTVLKLLLSKFAPLSIEMQSAVLLDQSVIKSEDGSDYEYVDNEFIEPDKEGERVLMLIENSESIEELESYLPNVKPEQMEAFNQKKGQLIDNLK